MLPRPSRRLADRRLGAAVLVLALAANPARAADPDEPMGLRVTRTAAGLVRLTWQAPAVPVDTYNVRRCHLPALAVPDYGNCVAEGLVAAEYEENAPAGSVFYLATAMRGGAEGSLGRADTGAATPPRTAPACDQPSLPGTMSVRVRTSQGGLICGMTFVLLYPEGAVAFASSDCTGFLDPALPASNANQPGRLVHGCLTATGGVGPGEVAQFTFNRAECPVTLDAFAVTDCVALVAPVDCGSFASTFVPCEVF